jgi:hypothetical protein
LRAACWIISESVSGIGDENILDPGNDGWDTPETSDWQMEQNLPTGCRQSLAIVPCESVLSYVIAHEIGHSVDIEHNLTPCAGSLLGTEVDDDNKPHDDLLYQPLRDFIYQPLDIGQIRLHRKY